MYMMLCMFGLMAGCDNQFDKPPTPVQVQEQQIEVPAVDKTTLHLNPSGTP